MSALALILSGYFDNREAKSEGLNAPSAGLLRCHLHAGLRLFRQQSGDDTHRQLDRNIGRATSFS
jgi:hypothetical protein